MRFKLEKNINGGTTLKRQPITHSVNIVHIGALNPFTYVDCASLEEAKLVFMDALLGLNETVTVEPMPSENPAIINRVKVTGSNHSMIVAIQKVG